MDKKTNDFCPGEAWLSRYRPTACLHVTGEDALSFLQGQFTQELRSSAPASAAYGLWLNQKGKVLADSFVLREAADNVWIISFSSSAETIRERLEAYIIADDVSIADVTAEWQGVAVGGPVAESWLAREMKVEVPSRLAFTRAGDGFVFHGRRDAGWSYEWLLPIGTAVSTCGLTEYSAEQVERLRISAGIPKIPQDMGIGDLPNEGGLDAAAVSYTKGCYLGQEVMARLKAIGTVRRRLVRVRAEGCTPPAVPAALLQGEKRVGELRSAVADGAGGFIGLAMITKLGLDPAALLAPEPGGVGFIELIDLP